MQGDQQGQETVTVLKRRSHIRALQRASVRRPEAAPRTRFTAKTDAITEETEQQEPIYENAPGRQAQQ